jgi:purine nucleosidase
VDVETHSELTRGMTVVDRLSVADDDRNKAVWTPVLDKGRKAKVCWTIDPKRWKAALLSALN